METQNGADVSYTVKDTGVKIVVGITCCLAMLGSLFIILSYALFTSLRSQARQILVNLSLMDFGIAMANVIGIAANFDGYYKNHTQVQPYVKDLCVAQAFVAMFTTYSSILWTISLAIYMYLLVFQLHRYPLRYYMVCCYAVCYGLSFGLSLWLLLTKRLGYAPYNSSGWCTLIVNNGTSSAGSTAYHYNASASDENLIDKNFDSVLTGNPVSADNITNASNILSVDYYAAIIGYDLWVYLAIVTCITLYLAVFLQLKYGYTAAIDVVGSRTFWKQALQFLDYKLLLIPLGFILVRVWTCVVNILFTYVGVPLDDLPAWLCNMLIYLSGIGDSGQGLVNGLIFVFLTAEVRQLMLSFVKRCGRRGAKHDNLEGSENIDHVAVGKPGNETTPLLHGHRKPSPSPVSDLITPPASLSTTVTPPRTRK